MINIINMINMISMIIKRDNHDDNCDNSDNNQDEPNGEEASVLLSDEGGKQPAVSILCRFLSIMMIYIL